MEIKIIANKSDVSSTSSNMKIKKKHEDPIRK